MQQRRSWGGATLPLHGGAPDTGSSAAHAQADAPPSAEQLQREAQSSNVPRHEGDIMAIDTDGSGTLLAGDKERFVIEIIDPGRLRRRLCPSVCLMSWSVDCSVSMYLMM